jgi:autotransporter-associated beta strand protein
MGGLTLSANTSNAVVVDLLGSANLNVTGPIVNGSAFAHGVNVGATGTNTFSGANTYTGTTKVSGNTLILSGTSASSGYILAGATTNVVLKVNAVNALNSSATLLGSSSSSTAGTLEFAAAGDYALNQYLGQNMNFSNSSGSAATLTFTNASNILGTATSGKTFANKSTNLTITFNGEVDISGAENSTNTISTLGPVVISNRVFNSNASFTRSLLKLETNSLTMYGVNSYNGTTIVSKGALNIPTGGSLTSCGDTIVKGSGTSVGNSASLNLAGSAGVVQVSTNGFVRGYTSGSTTTRGTISSLQVQEAGAVEVAVGTTWTTGGTIVFGTGSKVSVTGTPVSGDGPYTLMTASAAITGSPILAGAAGWALRVDGANLLLEEIDIYNIGVGVTTTFSDIITGTAPLVKKGLGTGIITGDNDYTGGTVLQAGTLQVENVNGLGTGAVTLTSGTLKSTVDLDLARLNPNTSTVGTGNPGYQETYGALPLLKYSGNSTTINGAVTLDVASATTMTMLTLVGNSDANSLVTKIGAGTLKLMGGTSTTVIGGWKIEAGTVWFTPSSNNGGGNGPITLAGGTAKFSKLQNSNGTFTGYEVPSDLTVESDGVIQYDPSPLTLLGQNNLGFNSLSIGARTLEVATATTSTVVGQGLPSVNFKSATLTGNATLKNPANLDLNLQAVSGTSGFTKTGLGTLYLSDQPNQAAAFARLTSGMTVESITVEYAGSGYAVAPAVTLVGGGGTGTTATATIDNKGRVTSIAVNTAGSGYTSLPRVVIAAPPTVATENTYTGPTTVQEGKLNLNGSYVSSVTVKSGAALQLDCPAPALARCSIDAISSGNSGYLTDAANAYVKGLYLTKSVKGYAPNSTLTLTIDAPRKTDGTTLVPGGVAATAEATVNSDGVISALTILTGGSGYVISPRVTIPPPTVPTVVATTTGSITFESGATLALNIASPTSASYTLITADGGIVGTPSLETAISGYALTKSIDGKSLILDQVDTTKPVITLIGSSTVNVDYGASYADLGATVDDNKDATRSINGVGSVNTLVPGSYTISFNTTDDAGNAADTVTRTVVVGPAPVTDGYAVYISSNGLPAGTAFNAKVNGVTAGLVYSFGSANGMPQNNGGTAVPVKSGNQLTYTFDVKDDSALTVTYQTSTDLVTWTEAQPVTISIGSSPAGFVKKQVQATGSGKLFVKINVTHP